MMRPPTIGVDKTAVDRAWEILRDRREGIDHEMSFEEAHALAHLDLALTLATRLAPSLRKWAEVRNAEEYLRERGVR